MTATINVNIAARHGACSTGHHDSPECAPIEIPCPIPPSVTFEVVLGECVEALKTAILPSAKSRCGLTSHHERCPARPVRVSCSISGKTWAESEVTTCSFDRSLFDPDNRTAAIECAGRWALVKALVLGHMRGGALTPPLGPVSLFEQRDAVFAALADLARAESGIIQAAASLDKAYPRSQYVRATPRYRGPPQSQGELEIWVAHLIEQVGNI